MWFKSMRLYRINPEWQMTRAQLIELLTPKKFQPSNSMEMFSVGWVPPVENGDLVHNIEGHWLLTLAIEKKLMPPAVIRQAVKIKCAETAEQQGHKCGRKQVREIKQQIEDEMRTRAFPMTTTTRVWIDPAGGWLAIDTSSESRARTVMRMLFKAHIEKFPVGALRTNQIPMDSMTTWLTEGFEHDDFTIDRDTVLESTGSVKSVVRLRNKNLDACVGPFMAEGLRCSELAMTWDSRISFMLTSDLTVKRIDPLEIVQKKKPLPEEFDGDMLLMCSALREFLTALTDMLGGAKEVSEEPIFHDLEHGDGPGKQAVLAAGGDDEEDPLYEQAVTLILGHKRCSISLVQRHLRIGYNRAARLLEAMEQNGVIGVMKSNGTREILQGGES